MRAALRAARAFWQQQFCASIAALFFFCDEGTQMHYSKLPASLPIDIASQPAGIVEALKRVLGSEIVFKHHGLITGLPSSGHVLACERPPGLSLAKFLTPEDAAQKLVTLNGWARRPAKPRETDIQPAWEIRRCDINGYPAAVAIACWYI